MGDGTNDPRERRGRRDMPEGMCDREGCQGEREVSDRDEQDAQHSEADDPAEGGHQRRVRLASDCSAVGAESVGNQEGTCDGEYRSESLCGR